MRAAVREPDRRQQDRSDQLFGKTLAFGAGNLFFPLSYLFGDVLTEVYGYARSRKVVWAGFGALAFASVMSAVVVHLPPAAGWHGQSRDRASVRLDVAHRAGVAGRLLLRRVRQLVHARQAQGPHPGPHAVARTIGSTIVGEACDTVVFYPLAFYGTWENDLLVKVMIANYIVKVSWEVVATPITYRVVDALKRAEHEDYYDRDTNFTPFSLSVR